MLEGFEKSADPVDIFRFEEFQDRGVCEGVVSSSCTGHHNKDLGRRSRLAVLLERLHQLN